jgi:hypothetical protein
MGGANTAAEQGAAVRGGRGQYQVYIHAAIHKPFPKGKGLFFACQPDGDNGARLRAEQEVHVTQLFIKMVSIVP